MDKFTIIAYKASWTDYCRNCVMGHHNSEFLFKTELTFEEVVKIWSDLDDKQEVHIIRNGSCICKDNYFYSRCVYDDDEYDAVEIENKKNSEILGEMRNQAIALRNAKIKAKKEKEQAELLEKKIRQELVEKAKRQKQFEELKREFGDG